MWDSLYPPSPREVAVPLSARARPMTPGERLRTGLLYFAFLLPLLWPFALAGTAIWLATDLSEVWSGRAMAVAGLGLATVGSLRAFAGRSNEPPQDMRSVSAVDQPGLWDFINKIAADQSARLPDGLIVNASAECRWLDRSTPAGGLRSHLVIGQWVVELFSLGELKALLSLRLARTRGLKWEQRHARLMQRLVLRLYGEDGWASNDSGIGKAVQALWWLSAWPVILVLKGIHWNESRHANPFAADETACQLTGTDATLLSMVKADHLRQLLKAVDALVLHCSESGFWAENLFTLTPDAIRLHLNDEARAEWQALQPPRTPTLARDREWFDLGSRYASDCWAGFPDGDRREERAKRDYLWNDVDSRPSTLLLDHLAADRRELSERHYRRLGEDITSKYAVPISLLRRWLYRDGDPTFPAATCGIYGNGRLVEPGSKADRETSVLPEDESDLWHALPTLYAEAATVFQRWAEAAKRADKIAGKVGRTRKDDIQAEHLTRAKREAEQALAGYDHRLHVVHRQLAARLDDARLAEELARRTEAVVRLQTLVSQARQWARVLQRDGAALAETLRPTGRFLREVSASVTDALDRLEEILEWAKQGEDSEVAALIEHMPLDHFLCSHAILPDGKGGSLLTRVEEAWRLWREVRRKADWLHARLVAGMVRVHEDIVTAFADRVEVSIN